MHDCVGEHIYRYFTNVCKHLYIYICLYICMSVCVYVYKYVCIKIGYRIEQSIIRNRPKHR